MESITWRIAGFYSHHHNILPGVICMSGMCKE